MADHLNWGIIATGNIAHQFAKGLKASKTGTLTASGSRDLAKAEKFAQAHGGRAVQGYQPVLDDPEVQAVYIAGPHHTHEEWTIKAAKAGKAILCEKPFTLNAIEAARALEAVQYAGVFFMEAFMYRCHPQTLKVKELVESGAIGRVLQINVEFGFAAGREWDNFRADGALGGGGLMDVGTYCVSFSRMVAGCEPDACHYVMEKSDKGYDASGAGVMHFPNDVLAHFGTGVHAGLRNDATVYGEKGRIHVADPWKCAQGSVTLSRHGHDDEAFTMNSTNDELYGIEADTVARYLDAGEAPCMRRQDTVDNMKALDSLRHSAGLKFAAEAKS